MFPVRLEEWGIRRLDALAARLRPAQAQAPHLETGLRGEREALFFLRRKGFRVVARRWTSAKIRGDVDLIAWQEDVLCFVEVKSRTTRDLYAAEVAVDRGKREQLRRLARAYLKAFDEPERDRIEVRFDVVSVYLLEGGTESELMESAFGWFEGPGNHS